MVFAANQVPLGGTVFLRGSTVFVALCGKGEQMPKKMASRRKPGYAPPKMLASYTRGELVETIRPHGQVLSYNHDGDGTGCGCGCS